MKKNKNKKIITIAVVLVILAIASLFFLSLISKPTFTIEYHPDTNSVSINPKSRNILNRKFWVAIDDKENGGKSKDWVLYENKQYNLNEGNNYIHIKDELGHIVDLEKENYKTVSLELNNNFLDLYPLGENIELDMTVTSIGKREQVTAFSSDDNIVAIDNGNLVCKGPGTATISLTSGDYKKEFDITVTGLYSVPLENFDEKPFLRETICTSEENKMLDGVLEKIINEAGYGTRAGVVAAARFIALQFPYKLAYFSESGRLDGTGAYVDGEGRYYHKGLYLSEDKFEEILASKYGPAYWGQFFKEDTTDDHSKDDYYLTDGFTPADISSDLYLMKRPNGFDCSGHVAWCYYNGGFDLGDIGAGGPGSSGMIELGELAYIDDELLQSDRIKAGDLVGLSAHVGIVVGVEDDAIWISDTMPSTGLTVKRYERNTESFNQLGDDSWQYFMLMDDVYKEDGNYTPMWKR